MADEQAAERHTSGRAVVHWEAIPAKSWPGSLRKFEATWASLFTGSNWANTRRFRRAGWSQWVLALN